MDLSEMSATINKKLKVKRRPQTFKKVQINCLQPYSRDK